ncbi:MAG: PilW family protein [Pseudomonadota bacterium]|nr:PilW family protein [Pseudomonadota bacterium]
MRRHHGGFSLIELLVGVVIGMLMILVIAQVTVGFEGVKRTSTSGSDAQSNGAAAIFLFEREIRMAGYGLVARGNLVCESGLHAAFKGQRLFNQTLIAPVRIVDGGSEPDRLVISRANARIGALPTLLIMDKGVDSVTVQSPVGLQSGDLFLMGGANGGKVCSILQLSANPTFKRLDTGEWVWVMEHKAISNDATPYNMTPATAFDPAVSYAAGDIISSIGTLSLVNYGLHYGTGDTIKRCNSLTAFSPVENPTAPTTCNDTAVSTLVDDIVYLKARYGVADAGSQAVNAWVAPTDIWAEGALTKDTIRRIKAIRVGVVARSQQYEREVVTASCSEETEDKQAKGTLTLWADGPTMSLSGEQCHYRYRVFETTIPIKNVIWGAV